MRNPRNQHLVDPPRLYPRVDVLDRLAPELEAFLPHGEAEAGVAGVPPGDGVAESDAHE